MFESSIKIKQIFSNNEILVKKKTNKKEVKLSLSLKLKEKKDNNKKWIKFIFIRIQH